MKVAVIYASTTGNTEAMANAICDSRKEKGADVLCATADGADQAAALSCDVLLLGSPAMGDEVLEDSVEEFFAAIEDSISGKKIGISKQALSSIERGVYWPGVDTLETIAVLCGLTLNDFSEEFSDNSKIWKKRTEFNDITDRERKLINRFRLLREDQRKALEVILHIQDSK